MPDAPLNSAASHDEFKNVVADEAAVKNSHVSDVIKPPTHESADAWFVRPPSGGQFGPASTGVLRRWITEGRVTADAFVWREGWGSWQKAEEVLEYKLAAQSISKPVDRKQLMVETDDGQSMLSRVDRHRPRKPSGIFKNMTTVVILATISVLLLIALVYVIISR